MGQYDKHSIFKFIKGILDLSSRYLIERFLIKRWLGFGISNTKMSRDLGEKWDCWRQSRIFSHQQNSTDTHKKALLLIEQDLSVFFHSPKFFLSARTWLLPEKIAQPALAITPILKISVALANYTFYFILYWITISFFIFMDCIFY